MITTFKDAGIEHALVATFPGPNASALLLFAADDDVAKQALGTHRPGLRRDRRAPDPPERQRARRLDRRRDARPATP